MDDQQAELYRIMHKNCQGVPIAENRGKIEVVKKLFDKGMDTNEIMEITGLQKEEVERWRNKE